jgi:hypothetical protein
MLLDSSMLALPLGPVRNTDLVHTQESLQAHGERILGHTRLSASHMSATAFGLVIDQSRAIRKWKPLGPGPADHCHLVDSIQLDEFGVHALTNQKVSNVPAGDFIAICPAYSLSEAAQCLRVDYLGRHLHLFTAPEIHAKIACDYLKIPRRPANDNRLPSVSEIRCGGQIRCDPSTKEAAERYFQIPISLDPEEPITAIALGGESSLVIAHSGPTETEPMRAIITRTEFEPTAERELTRWLKIR